MKCDYAVRTGCFLSLDVLRATWGEEVPDEQEPFLPESDIKRRYAVRETRVRLHQARFRGRVLPAHGDRCAVCRLKEVRLLDAAHILGDAASGGEPEVPNGLSLCTIHHRAFDQDLVGDSRTTRCTWFVVPRRQASRPDRERLAVRFDCYQLAG